MSNRQVLSTTGKVVEEAAIQKLAASVRGKILRPGDEGYESARKVVYWNPMTDKHPGMIVRCAGVADVIQAVDFARSHDLLVAVRGGGHSVSAMSVCDGGMVIDLSGMRKVKIDPEKRIARAEAGLTSGELGKATHTFGLAAVLGECPSVGIAGLTLGGGLGWLTGKYGASCDNLLSVEVVTADGHVLTASARENEDLFWGVRGGGGNFGVVTALEYRLYPVDRVLAGILEHPLSKASEVLRFFHEYMNVAPDELTALAYMPIADGAALGVVVCYCGDLQVGEKVLEPLRSFGRPVADTIQPRPYVEMQTLPLYVYVEAQIRAGISAYSKCGYLEELSDEVIDRIVTNVAQAPLHDCIVGLDHHMHGAVCRVGQSETAFSLREVGGYNFWIASAWQESAEADSAIGWVDRFWEALQPFSGGRIYVNYLSDEGEERVKAAYGTNYARLVALKNKYDPTNFFRLNQNIKPRV
ncbi:MAG: FAD-binding oxidoreductase [Deltaproteobacteria bacterium]|nr:FAD-binding oxidoreductase [Deltaproteobacteria bacterium]